MIIKYLFNQLKLYYSVFYSGTLLLWQILESTCRKEGLFWLNEFESSVCGQLAPLLWVTYDMAKLLTSWHILPLLKSLQPTCADTHICKPITVFDSIFALHLYL